MVETREDELERLREYKASREAQVRGDYDDGEMLTREDADYLRVLACNKGTVVRPGWLRRFADKIDATLSTPREPEEPSEKARELLEQALQAAYEGAWEGENDAASALLTYIADLERRAHPDSEVREALEEALEKIAEERSHQHPLHGPQSCAWCYAYYHAAAEGHREGCPTRIAQEALARLLGEEGGGS